MNELVLAGVVAHGLKRMMMLDPKLKAAFEIKLELEEMLSHLSQSNQGAILRAMKKHRSDQTYEFVELPQHLRSLAEDLIHAEREFFKDMNSKRKVRRGGNSVPTISNQQWSEIYDTVATLASTHFKRPLTRRSVIDAMAREKKQFNKSMVSFRARLKPR